MQADPDGEVIRVRTAASHEEHEVKHPLFNEIRAFFVFFVTFVVKTFLRPEFPL